MRTGSPDLEVAMVGTVTAFVEAATVQAALRPWIGVGGRPENSVAGVVLQAVLALPENVRNQTMVIKWKPDFTYDTLRKGANGLVCWDRSGFPLQQPFALECSAVANIERAAQNLKGEAVGDRAKANEMFNEQEKNGARVKPAFGSVWAGFSPTR